MRIFQIVPGTCNVFYCENCLRDDSLIPELSALGHETVVVPLYLPLLPEKPLGAGEAPIFFGGINVFLQQKFRLFRATPRWLDRLFDLPALLRGVSRFAGMTSAKDLGETTVSMLRGEHGHQAKELHRLVAWLTAQDRPDVVCFSNALLIGLAPRIRAALNVPIVCLLEDEDSFLDALPPGQAKVAWETLARRAAEVDAFIAVSEYYGGVMRERLKLADERVHVVPTGICLDGYEPAADPPDAPVIGFLSRLCRSHGLETLVEAFIRLRERGTFPTLTLRAAGGWTAEDEPYLRELRGRLAARGLDGDAEFLPNPSRAARLEFLRSLSVLSVPTVRGEAFGAYILEALASGVPVVQPRHGAFPELLEATDGGLLVEPNDADALADALGELLADPDRARAMGARGRKAVFERFPARRMARDVARIYEQVASRGPQHPAQPMKGSRPS